jgi:hypothetical protein
MTHNKTPSSRIQPEEPRVFFFKDAKDGALYLCANNCAAVRDVDIIFAKQGLSKSDCTPIEANRDFSNIIATISPTFMSALIPPNTALRFPIQTQDNINTKDFLLFRDEEGALFLGATNARARTQLSEVLKSIDPNDMPYHAIDKTTAYALDQSKIHGVLPPELDIRSVIQVTPELLQNIMGCDSIVNVALFPQQQALHNATHNQSRSHYPNHLAPFHTLMHRGVDHVRHC